MASINGLDTDLLNVSVLNANENIFIRGETGTQGQVISYDANRKIEFSDVVNDNDNIAVVLPLVKSIAGDPPVHTVSLGYNTSDFQLDGSNLLELKDTIVDTAVLPLSISGDTVSLGFNTNDFQLDIGSNLELKDTYVKNANDPLKIGISGGYATIGLEYNTSDFQLGSNKLELKDTYPKTATHPISITGQNIGLSINTDDLAVNTGNELQLAPYQYSNTMYYDASPNKYYKVLLPSDFMNDDDSSGYSRVVVRDFTRPGSISSYAGTQFYTFFEIPHGFRFTGFRINLVNSAGSPQGTIPSTSLYASVKRKSIGGDFTDINNSGGTNQRGYNVLSDGYTENAKEPVGWTISDIDTTYFYALHLFKSPAWSSSFFVRGGYLQFEKITPIVFSFVLENDYIDNIAEPILVYINAKPTGGKSYTDGDSNTYTSSDFDYQLGVAYPITMTTAAGGSLQGNAFDFDNLVNCSVSSTSWSGDNASPVSITFTGASSSMEFLAES